VLNEAAPEGKELKYARPELERRFLFSALPLGRAIRVARIEDRYLLGTRIRLRKATERADVDGEVNPDRVQADPEGARAGLFEDALHGLVLGEAEFADDESMTRFCRPAHAVAEVTSDPRLTGGQLIRTTRSELVAVLAEYGVAGLAR